jgi:hypothetical protein
MVDGGIFEDTSFEKVVEGTEESYGPFISKERALKEWKRRTFTQNLDICTHRMKVVEIN